MKTSELVSIPQAAKEVPITVSSIHGYMSRGMFTPYIYEPPPTGPGRGCKLDVPDRVTLGLIRSCIDQGARLDTFRSPYGADTPSSLVLFEREIHGAPKFTNDGRHRCPPEHWIKGTPATNIGPKREIQLFLEEFNFNVWVAITRKRTFKPTRMGLGNGSMPTANVQSIIYFFPSTQDIIDTHLEELSKADYQVEGVSFINAKCWYRRIQAAR